MKKLNVWSERTSENVGGNELLKQEMAQTGLFEKVKESYLKKMLDRGLELVETNTEKFKDKEYKARTSKS